SSPGKSNNVFDVSDDNLPSDGDGDGDSTNDPTITLTDPNPDMEVIKTAFVNDNGDGLTGAGDIVRYSIEVTNTGDITLDNVYIQTENLTDGNGTLLTLSSGPDYWQPQTIEVGESVIFTALYVISQEAANSGFITNTATAVGSITGNFNGIEDVSDNGTPTDDDGDGDPDNDPTVVLMDAPPVSSIEVTKEYSVVDNDGDNTNSLGDTINYVITVVNTGNTDLRDVILDDVISDLNGDPLILSSQPIFNNASLGSNEGILRQGESAIYNASYIITQQAIDAGGVSNTVTVVASSPGKTNDIFDISDDGDDTDGNTENDPTITRITTTPPPSSSITLTKAANIADTNGDGSIGIGDTITYTLVATNTGNDALSSVSITDVLSDLAGNTLALTTLPTFISASLGSLEGSLQVGEQATYRATFVVNSQAMNAGGVSNTATVIAQGTNGGTITDTSDDPRTIAPNSATITILTTVSPQSSLEVTKTATIVDNGNGTTGLGDTITFLITVENTGSTALNGVAVNDTFSDLSGNALALTTEPLFVSANLGSVEGTLLSGETAFYTATFIVNAQADNAGGVSNTASATATTPSGNTITDVSDDGDDTDGNTTNDPTVVAFFQNPVDGDFEVYNGMSPGSDGFNDYFKIAGIEKYPNNTVKIFNRWGVVVYEVKGYGIGDKLFMGISEGRITITKNQKLPEGTYFYVIEFEGDNPGRERYTGYLYINRD
ncbi:MAG: gliding motility-associated C-terminal domain-containing protein, partial [Bacteroidota bacterium]|nr:gliding motility-associated C-terminal domain-containing protein [Bacteroidota bacterium]